MVTDAKDLNFNKNNYVCFSNDFAFARQNLSKISAIILRILISNITPNDEEFFTYVFSVVELANFLSINKSNIYTKRFEISRELIAFTITIENEKIRVLSNAEYINGYFYIKLSDQMAPFFLNLEKHYFQYPLGAVLLLKKSYSLRLFEIFWARDGFYNHERSSLKFTVFELREALGCKEKYSGFDLFHRKVLVPALKEISLYTNLNVLICNTVLDKNHRKIEKVELEIHKKPSAPGQILL